MLLARHIVQFFSFVDCVKKWDWQRDGEWAEKVVRRKFNDDRKKRVWKKFSGVRDFNKRVCNCKCMCECAETYFEFVSYKNCHESVCGCKCSYKNVILNVNDEKKIAECMKNWGEVEVDYNDFNWDGIFQNQYLLPDIEQHVDMDTTFGRFEKFLIELFELFLCHFRNAGE